VSVTILGLYGWAYFAHVAEIGAGLLVSDTAALFAGIALIAGVVAYLWAPQKYSFWGSLGAFLLLSTTIAILVLSTGGITSPFIALWMLAAVFAGVFGLYGLLPLLLASLAYLLLQYSSGTLSKEIVVTVVLAGELPLAVSYLIWHAQSSDVANKKNDENGGAYHALASEFSQVTEKSEVVINAIADGVIALNGKGAIQLINPAAQQITGWTKQDALTLDYKSVLKLLDKTEHDVTPANDPIAQGMATNKETHSGDLSLITNAGKKILVSIIVSPVGQPGAGVIIVFRDITLEKRDERQQAEFISTAAHEMRTPVASIEGYLGLALNPATAQVDEKARDFINKAHASAQHLGNLFQDLLDVSKADDGRLTNNPKVVDVVAFTHDIVEGLRPKAEEKGLRLLFKPQPDDDEKIGERRLNPVYYANVDNDHLREVIANLVENAIKYTPTGDAVVDIGGDNDHIQISIADSGIGIPKEDQGHLFQKFYRVDNSDTREIGGTGLGLYLCRRLVETMNGRIWLESEYKKGSTFFVEIPRIDHEEATRLIESASIEQEHEIEVQQTGGVTLTPNTEPVEEVGFTTAPPHIQETVIMPPSQQTQPAPAPAQLTSDETVYTNAPVKTVVQQMQQAAASQQPPAQASPPQPVQQLAPQQQPYPSMQQSPQFPQRRQAPVRENIPLSSIEQHPDQYLRRPGSPNVPPRS
jgi:PAS domain S-box-containing protein